MNNQLFTKQQLIDGEEFTFNNEENGLDIWHKAKGPNWMNPFQGMFNGEFFSFKTFTGLEMKVLKLIETHNLKKPENQEE
jgi:hypothetical protein